MPLKLALATKLINPMKLMESDIMFKAHQTLGERVFNSMIRRLVVFVNSRKQECSGAYTIFAIGLGNEGIIAKTDYDYLWEKAITVYGDTDLAKRFLGTMLMYCFAIDSRNWLFIQDPEKSKKLSENEIPDATKYFLDTTGKGYAFLDEERKPVSLEESIKALKAKFNVR